MAHQLRIGLVVALFALTLLAPAAKADHLGLNPPWPQILPPLGSAPTTKPHPVVHCREPSIACVAGLERRIKRQWRPLDRACDHRAVPALAYLRITQELRRQLKLDPSPIRFHRWMEILITTFSNRYFDSFDRFEAGLPVPEAWRIAFDAYAEADISAGQDVLLFSNAHVQHDLPFALAEVGLRSPAGLSRKPDHDQVNDVNTRIFDPFQDEISERYDPLFPLVDLSPSPLDELGAQETVKLWRETAWRNAERLVSARSQAERERVVDSIRANSTTWARLIASGEFPGYRDQRDAYCNRLAAG